MTPREFDALCQREAARQRRADLRIGLVASVMTALWSDKAMAPTDFFPETTKETAPKEMTPDESAAYGAMLAAQFGSMVFKEADLDRGLLAVKEVELN